MKRKEVKLFKPHKGQQEVIQALIDPNIFVVTAVIGRQWGKSFLGINMALYWLLNDEGCNVYWVSPTDSQARKIYTQITIQLKDTGIVKSKKGTSGDAEIVFVNGSVIKFRSSAAENSLRGESINYLIVDEAAFVKEETYNTILLPMLTTAGKKIYLSTTPKGKNWIYKKFNEGLTLKNYRSFRFSSYDSPYASEESIENFRNTLSEGQFKQEIEAQFVDKLAVFSNINELLCLERLEEPNPGQNYYGGLDIGLQNDAAVLTILDQSGNLVNYYRWMNYETDELMDEIVRANEKWKFKKITIEENNQGLPIYHMLKKRINRLDKFYTGASSKLEIINKLINLFNTKKIKLIDDNDLRVELEAFIFKQTPTGHTKFAAANGFTDDIVMSLAIGVNSIGNTIYNDPNNRPTSTFRII